MKKRKLGLTLLSAMTAAALVAPGVAFAQDAEVDDAAKNTIDHIVATGKTLAFKEESVTVSFADLDLEHEPGALALYQRLTHAAEIVCDVSDARKTRMLADQRQADDCYARALNAAVAAVGSELVMSIHHERGFGEMLAAKVR